MSYQVLARKWRPKTFSELMGQEHVVTVLVNALQQQRLHHAYLFTGTRGVGKTTIARIFAKSLNCAQGVSATPCGKCDICQDIDLGRFIDLIEIDAASRTKVDDTREILDNVQYAPSRGRYKVYLIDEVHMLSRSSFNALLKTLEEPPEHVKFILATTDPQKLPVTVLSRCLQFHLKALTTTQIETKLNDILTQEGVGIEPGTLSIIAKAARGSMRDSLSLTDQAIAQGQGQLTIANIQQMLGGVDHNWPYKLLIHLIKNDSEQLMQLSLEIASYAPSYSRLLAEFLQLLHQIALLQVTQNHFDVTPEQEILLHKFAKAMSPEDVQLYYQIALNGRKDLPYAADEQAGFDMVLLRLLAFKPMQYENYQESTQVVPESSSVELSTESLTQTTITQQTTLNHDEATLPDSEKETAVVESLVVNESTPLVEAPTVNKEADLTKEMLQIEQDAYEQGYSPEQQEQNLILKETAEISTAAATAQNEQTAPENPIDAVLSTRNMLRSRRKQLGDAEKKFNGVNERQQELTANESKINTNTENSIQSNESSPAASIKEQNTPVLAPPKPEPTIEFTPEIIDPAKHKHANQVDRWAHMIDAMSLGGRLRQLAIHSTIDDTSSEDYLCMRLNQINKHLLNDNAQQQLEQSICNYLQKNISVKIIIVEDTEADPYKIQSHINEKRLDFAKEVIENDEMVQAIQKTFQATIDVNSIKAL